jgi:dTMP kinase
MQKHPGLFIVIEGSDGSGKTTQFHLTVERLKAVGHEVRIFKFPQHEEQSSFFVEKYLKGEYGPAKHVSPYTASLFYALDRYHASAAIKEALDSGAIVVADRYVGSNMAHQGSKFINAAEQRGFFLWDDDLEYRLLGIPRPNLNIFLEVPIEISTKLMSSRTKWSYSDAKLDEHEADVQHLSNTIAAYGHLCKLFPKDFKKIRCVHDNQLLGIVDINNKIWEIIKPLLPQPRHHGKGSILKLDIPIDDQQRTSIKPEKISSIVESKANKLQKKQDLQTALKLLKATPHNELSLLSNGDDHDSWEKWSYQIKKKKLLQKLPKLLEFAQYTFQTGSVDSDKLILSAKDLLEGNIASRKLYESLVNLVCDVHPLLGQYLIENLKETNQVGFDRKSSKRS